MQKMYHSLLKTLQNAPKKEKGFFDLNKYVGTIHPILGLSNPVKYQIAKEFKKDHPDISYEDLIELIDHLYAGETFEEKTIGPFILDTYKNYKEQLTPIEIERWLEYVEGWCEIDTLCQSRFTGEALLDDWDTWKKTLQSFTQSKHITKRRASLVLLCKAVRTSDDKKISKLAFENIDRLKTEKDILITKAISWLLRDLIKNHRQDVERYLRQNNDTLPKIALRETRNKLLKGKKI